MTMYPRDAALHAAPEASGKSLLVVVVTEVDFRARTNRAGVSILWRRFSRFLRCQYPDFVTCSSNRLSRYLFGSTWVRSESGNDVPERMLSADRVIKTISKARLRNTSVDWIEAGCHVGQFWSSLAPFGQVEVSRPLYSSSSRECQNEILYRS